MKKIILIIVGIILAITGGCYYFRDTLICNDRIEEGGVFGGALGDIICGAEEAIYGPLPLYPYLDIYGEEDIDARTYTTKHYPAERKIIGAFYNLHYSKDGKFEDILPLPFPEGKEIASEKIRHEMMNLPKWGHTRVEQNGKAAVHYDENGMPIYVFKEPIVVPKGKAPYKVLKKAIAFGAELEVISWEFNRYSFNINEELEKNERIEPSDDALAVNFEIENNKLYYKDVSAGLTYPLEAYDSFGEAVRDFLIPPVFGATATGAMTKDAYIDDLNPTLNAGSSIGLAVKGKTASQFYRSVIHFDVMADPDGAGSNTITDIDLKLYAYSITNAGADVDVHELDAGFLQWVEAEVTWNIASTGGNWDTVGGNCEDGPCADSVAPLDHNVDCTSVAWMTFALVDTTGSPSYSKTWGESVHILLKDDDEDHTANDFCDIRSSETVSPNIHLSPYFEVTYAPTPSTPRRRMW